MGNEKQNPQIDWQQVALNGGPPCFFVEGPQYCGRAERWPGHGNEAFHDYVSLDDLLATVRKEEREAADSERRDILNAIEHSQRLCTHRAQDNSKTGEYRLMMEHFAEAGRQIAEMITGKRYQDLARPINQTEP